MLCFSTAVEIALVEIIFDGVAKYCFIWKCDMHTTGWKCPSFWLDGR